MLTGPTEEEEEGGGGGGRGDFTEHLILHTNHRETPKIGIQVKVILCPELLK
jgi:hypothetical protein